MAIDPTSSISRSLTQASQGSQRVGQQLSSGQRINSAADDAAGSAIASRFQREVDGFSVAIRNSGDGISLLQTEEGYLAGIGEQLQRIRELSLQAANGSLTDADRSLLQTEVASLSEGIENTLAQAEFNGKPLFNEAGTDQFQIGPNAGDTLEVGRDDLQAAFSDLADLDISTAQGAQAALTVSDELLAEVSERGAELGALNNRFSQNIEKLEGARINSEAARSRIEDADYAQLSAERSRQDVLEQVSLAMLSQANQNRGQVLQLLS